MNNLQTSEFKNIFKSHKNNLVQLKLEIQELIKINFLINTLFWWGGKGHFRVVTSAHTQAHAWPV